jgi:putative ATP-dependent endonuclease of the OLD family
MKIAYVDITNFRGIAKGRIYFNGHSVLIGDNNAGKSTVFEAIDLVLGPDRSSRIPVIDEHDFFNGKYLVEQTIVLIEIEVLVIDLTDDQKRKFKNNLEFWHLEKRELIGEDGIDGIDDKKVTEALRVKFVGSYDNDEDDFKGETFYCSPIREDGILSKFSKTDKRECGFLYLRALRTGSRALSLERGSLLDIILRIREIRPKMWEDVLTQLKATSVAEDAGLGVHDILTNVQKSLQEFVPSDWGAEPHLRVSDLTREHLRKTLTVFMSTGKAGYYAPFQHQGTGTINTMVLALLSMIAEAKNTVIFAMEEPEIAIPPYTQKRIVDSICKKSTQAIFSTHSPFVLEEFSTNNIILIHRNDYGEMKGIPVKLPSMIKAKSYSKEFRLRFAEALLAKRVLLTEGATEASSYSFAARHLAELESTNYTSLEGLGIAVFDAESQNNIPIFAEYFKAMDKLVFAVFDKQTPEDLLKIKAAVTVGFESQHKGFEELILEETDKNVLEKFAIELISNGEWPTHLTFCKPCNTSTIEDIKKGLLEYFRWSKGAKSCAALLSTCNITEMPSTIKSNLSSISMLC